MLICHFKICNDFPLLTALAKPVHDKVQDSRVNTSRKQELSVYLL